MHFHVNFYILRAITLRVLKILGKAELDVGFRRGDIYRAAKKIIEKVPTVSSHTINLLFGKLKRIPGDCDANVFPIEDHDLQWKHLFNTILNLPKKRLL